MIQTLYRPLTRDKIVFVAIGIAVATSVYCMVYNALSGRSESVAAGVLWALVNVVPWYLAFEAAKRASSAMNIVAALLAALFASMLLQISAYGFPELWGFQLIRRIPYALAVITLIGLGRLAAVHKSTPLPIGTAQGLPLAPQDFDWVSAAGNYVELRSSGRAVLHRAPLNSVHVELKRHGFVRIHRSILVRRDKIARIRPNDVVLTDGTSLKIGKRYRSSLH